MAYSQAKSVGASGKYRTYQRGESSSGKVGSIGGSVSSSSSGSGGGSSSSSSTGEMPAIAQEATFNPSSGIGVRFPTAGGKTGYAPPGAQISYGSKSAITASGGGVRKQVTNVYNPVSSQSQVIVTSSGRVVPVSNRSTSSYANVTAEREAMLKKSGGQNLSEKQLNELTTIKMQSQPRQVAVDFSSVQKYNEFNKARGINNAQDYFNRVRNPPVSEDAGSQPANNIYTFGFTAPRQVARDETTPVYSDIKFNDPFASNVKYGGQINAFVDTSKAEKPFLVAKEQRFEEAFANYNLKINKPGNELFLLSAIPARATYGFISASLELGKGARDIFINAPKGKRGLPTLAQAEYSVQVFGGVVEGTAEQIGTTVSNIGRGDIPALSEDAGRFYAQYQAGKYVESKMFTSLKKATVDFKKDLIFRSATEFNPKEPIPPGGSGGVPLFTIRGREGVLVPPEYKGGQSVTTQDFLKAPELQTQLYPKRIGEPYLKQSLFSPEPYKPQSFTELAKKEPNLAKELAKESGQTVFNPNEPVRIRDLTSEERLSVAKEQAGLKSGELQKTLTGYPPKKSDFVILKDNKIFFQKEGNVIEVKQTPLFAFEPVTASVYTLIQEGSGIYSGFKDTLRDFKRTNLDIGASDILTSTKSSKIYAPIVLRETRDFSSGTVSPTIRSVSSSNKASPFVNSLNINRQKIFSDTSTLNKINYGSSSISALDVAQVQTQVQEQKQDSVFNLAQTNLFNDSRSRSVYDFGKITTETPNPKIPFQGLQSSFVSRKKKRAFNVFVRKRGVFIQANKKPLEQSEAINFGKNVLSTTARASFKLKSVDVNESQIGRYAGPSRGNNEFYTKGDTIIQKRGFRIGSVGEKQEITYKGILTSKLRRNLYGEKRK